MQDKIILDRIKSLQKHLAEENPLLVEVVDKFVELDQVGLGLGVLTARDSYTTDISWWPLISVLGTFSAGKSSFINQYVGHTIQKTGNQAVDDKFTVLCFSSDQNVRVLPGIALDADPRFPFYQMSEAIDKVAEGEGASAIRPTYCTTSKVCAGRSKRASLPERNPFLLTSQNQVIHESEMVMKPL